MELLGRDADLRAQPEFGTVRKAGRGVEINGGSVHLVKEGLGARALSVTEHSLWPVPYCAIWVIASSSESTTRTARI